MACCRTGPSSSIAEVPCVIGYRPVRVCAGGGVEVDCLTRRWTSRSESEGCDRRPVTYRLSRRTRSGPGAVGGGDGYGERLRHCISSRSVNVAVRYCRACQTVWSCSVAPVHRDSVDCCCTAHSECYCNCCAGVRRVGCWTVYSDCGDPDDSVYGHACGSTTCSVGCVARIASGYCCGSGCGCGKGGGARCGSGCSG